VDQLSVDARKVLVESYVALRRSDAVPGSQVAYRITVRQLEALVRLSEAIARCHLSSEVSPFVPSGFQISVHVKFLAVVFLKGGFSRLKIWILGPMTCAEQVS
jgi:hypothetical protein